MKYGTRKGLTRFHLIGPERAMLYRLAAETGLRRNELRNLQVSSFDFDKCTVVVEAAYSKRRREDIIPLKPDTVSEFKHFVSGRHPNAPVFSRINNKTSDMLKADLADAEISYCDE